MGKAALRRKARRKDYLAELSRRDPARFAREWDKRLNSWLFEIRSIANEWAKGGIESHRHIFSVVDAAMDILSACEASVYHQHKSSTFDLLSNEAAAQTARVTDRRLYRPSNMASLAHRAARTTRV